jgi:hypothetical protein
MSMILPPVVAALPDLLAEALNLIFVKYGKPEIAPRKE